MGKWRSSCHVEVSVEAEGIAGTGSRMKWYRSQRDEDWAEYVAEVITYTFSIPRSFMTEFVGLDKNLTLSPYSLVVLNLFTSMIYSPARSVLISFHLLVSQPILVLNMF